MSNESEMGEVRPDITIEPAKPADAAGITDVQRLTWLATYPNAGAGITEEDVRLRVEGEHGEKISAKIERWQKTIETADNTHAIFVAREGAKVVGYASPRIEESGRRELAALYVLPEFQSQGTGANLLQEALAWHDQKDDIYLTVAAYNQQAINFYKKFGFEPTGHEPSDRIEFSQGKVMPLIEMVLKANQPDRS